MTLARNDIVLAVRDIMRDLFDLDDLEISDQTTADDVEDWDSLSHIRLMVSIEKHFGIKFTTAEIESFERVGTLIDTIQAKLPA